MSPSYQTGTLRRVKRAGGKEAWEWRYRLRGKQQQETFKVEDYPTQKLMWQRLEQSISTLNEDSKKPLPITVTMGMLIKRYRKEHLSELRKSTRDTDGSMLHKYIEPKWGETRLSDLRAMDVDAWLKTLPIASSSRGRARRLMKQLLDKAMFWELMPIAINPITLVKVKGASLRVKRVEPYTPEQVMKLYGALKEPYSVMIAIAASLGLRVEEVIPLQWTDFDFKVTKKVFIQRAYTHGELGAPKSTASAAELPLPEDLIEIIQAYRPSVGNSIWLFPSPVTGGPRSADMILADHLKPAAKKLGLPKPGWHTSFRHGYRSWLGAGTATTSQQKDLMRHAALPTTMEYGGTPVEEMRPLVEAVSSRLKLKPKLKTPANA